MKLIPPLKWPTTADGVDPVPTVKGSSVRPGVEKITVRVPTHKARTFKLYCSVNGLKQEAVIEELLDMLFASIRGRPDGQTARRPDENPLISGDIYGTENAPDLMIKNDLIDEEEEPRLTSSSSHVIGPSRRPDDSDSKRKSVLAYYRFLTGNPIKQNDRDALETVLELPLYAIKAGIGKSFLLCKQQVHSLRYCLGAIEEIAEDEPGESYLDYIESVLRRENKYPLELKPQTPALKQPALPGTAADLIELKKEDPQ